MSCLTNDADARRQLDAERLRFDMLKKAYADGYPPEFAELLDCSSKEAAEQDYKRVGAIFNRMVSHAVEERFRGSGRTPERSTGGYTGNSLDSKLHAAFAPKER